MARGASYTVQYRRKREQKTNYKRRLNLLKSGKIRFISRPSNKHMVTQLVEYGDNGDKVLASAHSKELAEFGWTHSLSNTPAAYLTGLLCGVRGKGKGVEEAILDTGLYPQHKGSKIFASLKGLKDAGVKSPADEGIFPSEDRITGKVIASYVEKSGGIENDFARAKADILKSSK